MALIETQPGALTVNPFTTISKEWFLLTAGDLTAYNTMTCSWGAMGEIWNKPSLTAYVRTSRHTYGFMEKQPLFTVSVLPEQYREALAFCGSHSGRDCDKAKETGLHPVALGGSVAFAEAKLVFVCEKVYAQMMDTSCFVIPEMAEQFYGADPMHKMFIGRVLSVYTQS